MFPYSSEVPKLTNVLAQMRCNSNSVAMKGIHRNPVLRSEKTYELAPLLRTRLQTRLAYQATDVNTSARPKAQDPECGRIDF